MYTFRCAYRFGNGQVEGLTGFGFGEYSARRDCMEQIRRKLSVIPGASLDVVESRVIYDQRDVIPDVDDPRAVTAEEMERIRQDWACGRRYAPDGSPYPGHA
jgi:hypothetical protein